MAQTTIEQFASELKMPSGALLEQLAAAGVDVQRDRRQAHGAGQDAPSRLPAQAARRAGRLQEAHHADAQADHRDQGGRFERQVAHDPGRGAQEARARAPRGRSPAAARCGAGGRGRAAAGRRAGSRRRRAAARGRGSAAGARASRGRSVAPHAAGGRRARGGVAQGAGALEAAAGGAEGEAGPRSRAQEQEGARGRRGRQGRGSRREGRRGQAGRNQGRRQEGRDAAPARPPSRATSAATVRRRRRRGRCSRRKPHAGARSSCAATRVGAEAPRPRRDGAARRWVRVIATTTAPKPPARKARSCAK